MLECLDDAVLGRGPRRCGDLVVRRRRRTLGREARAVLGARRRARRRRLPPPVRLQPRRAARPVLPLEHRRAADRERRGAVAPDLLGRARPASRPRRSSPRTAAGTCRSRSGARTARGGCGPRRSAASTSRRRYLRKLWFDTVVHDPQRTAAPRRGRRRLAGAARQRLPVRHGSRRPRRRDPVGRAARRDHARASSARTPRRCSRHWCGHEDRAVGVPRRRATEGETP